MRITAFILACGLVPAAVGADPAPIQRPVAQPTSTPAKVARIYVMGQVHQPGAYALEPKVRLTMLDAIRRAGGAADGHKDTVFLFRGKGAGQRYPLNSILTPAVPENEIVLRSGDVVFVGEPPAGGTGISARVPARMTPAAVAPAADPTPSIRAAPTNVAPAGVPTAPARVAPASAAPPSFGLFAPPLLTQKVDLDLNDVRALDAIRQIAAQSKLEVRENKDATTDTRVTVRAKAVQLSTALDLVTQAAGLAWTLAQVEGKPVVQVGKNLNAFSITTVPLQGSFPLIDQFLGNGIDAGNGFEPHAYLSRGREERSTFTCPHCKGQSTVLRQRVQPDCPKCAVTFQPTWQFCPRDGTKRPATGNEWKFCPHCGKRVEVKEAAKVPILGDMPIIGQLFRNATPAK